jgi:hypothetical protein
MKYAHSRRTLSNRSGPSRACSIRSAQERAVSGVGYQTLNNDVLAQHARKDIA